MAIDIDMKLQIFKVKAQEIGLSHSIVLAHETVSLCVFNSWRRQSQHDYL